MLGEFCTRLNDKTFKLSTQACTVKFKHQKMVVLLSHTFLLFMVVHFATGTSKRLATKLDSTVSSSPRWNESICSLVATQSAPNCSCEKGLPCLGDDACPPGLFCQGGYCSCGRYPNRILTCNGTNTFILRRNCVTYDKGQGLVSAGNCIRRHNKTTPGPGDDIYHLLPQKRTELDENMCKPLMRTGTLCGKCRSRYYPLAYSYNMNCILCPNVRWNWVKYIMAAYLPLTFLYIVIVFFKVNTTSSHLFPVVFFCQSVSAPLLLRMLFSIFDGQTNPFYFAAINSVFSLYGIWNLDFFRLFYTEICLGLDVLPTLTLDYAIAVYPILLMIISYLLISLYDRYKIVCILWRPFQNLFSLLRRKWDIRTSLIDVFASFFFLSNIKLLSVSFDLLIPTRVYHLYPDRYNYSLALLYAGHIDYFGTAHRPYAFLAIAVLCIFVALPVAVLALYPFAFFHKILDMFPFRWYILHTFVDAFYGLYKDGTQPGTRDYRWFASTFFGVRFIQLSVFALSDATVSLAVCALTMFTHAAMVAYFQPFRSLEVDYNTTNTLFLQFAALFASTAVSINFCTYLAVQYLHFFYVVVSIIAVVPLLYAFASTFYWLYRRKKFGIRMVQHFRAWWGGYDTIPDLRDYRRDNLANVASAKDTV